MDRAASGDRPVGRGDEIKIVEPFVNQLCATDRDGDGLRVKTDPTKVLVVRIRRQGADGNAVGCILMLGGLAQHALHHVLVAGAAFGGLGLEIVTLNVGKDLKGSLIRDIPGRRLGTVVGRDGERQRSILGKLPVKGDHGMGLPSNAFYFV